ncbi:MAG: J domain-containing protein [Verrucomicrobia bacterium]|nr:J domain-containing protein [Verrucomicrobiota bacterium]
MEFADQIPMEAHELENWLRRRSRREHRRSLMTALGGGMAGGALLLLTGVGLASVLLAGWVTFTEAAGVVLGRSLEVQFGLPQFWGLVAGVILLLFAGNSRGDREAFIAPGELDWRDSLNAFQVLRAVAGVFAEVLYSGPRLLLAGVAAGRRASGWRRMNFQRGARVLFELHCHASRVPLRELAKALPGLDLPDALAELRLLRGVMLLESPPPGASLSSELRRQFGLPPRWADTPAMPDESNPAPKAQAAPRGPKSAKPPSFRCVECLRKFRLRNLRGGVLFHCPLCGAPYRTRADAQGRVQIEHRAEGSLGIPLAPTVQPAGSHDVLGVAAGASADEIKHAYRRMMKEHHPDRVACLSEAEQAQAEERSKEINRAYAQMLGKA